MPWSNGNGGDSCPEGRGLKSQHRILDGHFSPLFVVMFARKDENKQKIGRDGPFSKNIMLLLSMVSVRLKATSL